MIPFLTDSDPFPAVERALHTPNGLLAAGDGLSTARLLDAYRNGIFPWFNPDEPVLWWSPDPRMVLIPSEFHRSASLAKRLRKRDYRICTDTCFEKVMRACAAPRDGHQGTWISAEMIAAYCALHTQGYAHSIELWQNDELVGGLYGVSLGKMFYGESMFSRISSASKIVMAHLACQLQRWQFGMIDCQMYTSHLASLGAREMPRKEFVQRVQELVNYAPATHWQFDDDLLV